MIGNISSIDAAIIVAYLLFAVGFGIWIGRGQKSVQDYFLGGADLPWWAVLGSIVATETSTATFLSIPAIAYAVDGDLWFLQLALGYIVGRILIVFLFLPGYFQGQILTAYELLDQQFGSLTKRVASVLFLIARNLGDGLRLFLTALALQAVTGTSVTQSAVIVGILTIVYTFAGGMRSVVWNDCIQFLIYTLGGAAAFGVLLSNLPGGWSEYIAFGELHEKFRVFHFDTDLTSPKTFWAGLIGGLFLTLGTHGTDQMMVQRYLCARTHRGAAVALVSSAFVVLAQFALFLLLGVALACFYHHPPESPFHVGDQVLASFIVEQLPVGLVGLCLAAVFAAAMSTLSSSLNSSAASALNDLLNPMLQRQQASPQTLVRVSRGLTIAFGVLQILIAVAAQELDRAVVLNALSIAGFVFGLLLGVFALGLLPFRMNETPVLVGMTVGLFSVSNVWFHELAAWPWFAVIGSLTTFMVALICQLLWNQFVRPIPRESDSPH